MKRALLILGVVGVIAFAVYRLWSAPMPAEGAAREMETVAVRRDNITSEVAASGSVEAERVVGLSFRAPGRVAEVHVSVGDWVETDQPLVELDPSDIEIQVRLAETALALAEAQASRTLAPPTAEELAAARASLASAQASYNRAMAGPSESQATVAAVQLQKAEIALQRAQSAYDEVKWVGAIAAMPQSLSLQAATLDYEAAKANHDIQTKGADSADLAAINAQIAQARAQLARLEQGASDEDRHILDLQVEQARISLEQARTQLENTVLRAPFAGQVAAVNAVEGQLSATGLATVTLLDCNCYHVSVPIDEGDIGLVAVGQSAVVQPEAFTGVSLAGHVARIGLIRAGSESGGMPSASGVVQYEVRVDVDEELEGLRPGMTAQVLIEVDRREGTLVLPNRAVQLDRGTSITFVERMVDGQPVRTEVILGAQGVGVTEILAGVQEGDQVVIPGTTSLEEQIRTTFGPMGG